MPIQPPPALTRRGPGGGGSRGQDDRDGFARGRRGRRAQAQWPPSPLSGRRPRSGAATRRTPGCAPSGTGRRWQSQIEAQQAPTSARPGTGARRGADLGTADPGVIDRALSQVGVQYVWGGGTGRGPSTGIPDAFGSPLNRIGFDCSGLMLYAYNAAGVALPRVSRNQFNAGRKVPVSDLRAGDMVFFKNGTDTPRGLYIATGRWSRRPTPVRREGRPARTRGLSGGDRGLGLAEVRHRYRPRAGVVRGRRADARPSP